MDRVLQGTANTIYGRFYVSGTGTNPSPDSATVTITRADGTVLQAATAATDVAGVGNEGLFSFQLTTTHTALLDRLTASWVSNLGTVTTVVEVAGGFLFSPDQVRAEKPLDNATTYPYSAIVATRTLVETALEDACGVAFVPRYERERVTGSQAWSVQHLRLKWPKVRTIRAATSNNTALTAQQLTTVLPVGGFFYYPSGWGAWGASFDVTVGYEHGYDFPPPRVQQAAVLLAKQWLVAGPVDDRTTSMSTEDGTFLLSTPGMRGASFGIPEVDAVVNQYQLPVVV